MCCHVMLHLKRVQHNSGLHAVCTTCTFNTRVHTYLYICTRMYMYLFVCFGVVGPVNIISLGVVFPGLYLGGVSDRPLFDGIFVFAPLTRPLRKRPVVFSNARIPYTHFSTHFYTQTSIILLISRKRKKYVCSVTAYILLYTYKYMKTNV